MIDAMAQALKRIASEQGYAHVVLIGYSGGGTLAMLLAEQVPNVVAVVTIAGNLDPDEWARHHDYSPLWTSLNPSSRTPLPPAIFQLHVAAENDGIVPAEMVLRAAAHQHDPEIMLVPGADHACCWLEMWPSVLATLDARVEHLIKHQ